MNAPVVTFEVAQRFSLLRRRLLAAHIGITISILGAMLMVLWIGVAAGDYVWEWSPTVRAAVRAAGVAAVFAWAIWRLYAVVRACRRRPLVGRLERSYEGFGQRIRTVLDTVDGRVTAPGEMLAALGHQTLGRWETLGPLQLVPIRALAVSSMACLSLVVFSGGLISVGGDWRGAMLRALGIETPYTTFTVTPGNARLLEGSAVDVSLELRGRTERDVTLRYRTLGKPGEPGDDTAASIAWTDSELVPSEPSGTGTGDARQAVFVAGLGKATERIEYQFVTSVGSTKIFHIDIQPLIEVQRIEAEVTPPEYTELPPRSFPSADITVLEQSQVTVTIQTNHPLADATLEVGPKPSKLQAASLTPTEDATRWSFQLPSIAPVHWRFSGAGNDGTPMAPVKGQLRVLRDRGPTLVWRDPADEIQVHTLAELPMRLQVSDDYGIAEAGIVFQLGSEEYVLTDWTAADAEDQSTSTTRTRLEKMLPLESFALSERDYVAYHAYAIDNRGWGPQRSETDIRYIDIRPLRQFYSEQDAEPNEGPGGRVLAQLSEIIRRQRFLINQTRKLERSANIDLSTQLGQIDRMVENQSELASLTRYLAEFLVSRGNDDVEALNQAEAAMLQAADSLAAGSFDLALVQEDDALRSLAEARRTLEIVLMRNMTPAEQRALQQFARQLQQKLRRERPETEQEIADTLQRLAAEQTRLGETAAKLQQKSTATGGGGPPNPEAEATPDGAPSTGDEQNSEAGGEEETQPSGTEDSTEDAEAPASEEASGDDQAPENTDDAPSPVEEQESLFAAQIDLLERLHAIADQLADRLSDSPLMAQRVEKAKEAMDELATRARDGSLEEFPFASRDAAEQLRELGLQLDAIAAVEPVSRVSSIRDLTASMVKLESDLAQQLHASAEDLDADAAAAAEPAALAKAATRVRRRAETIEDVLKVPAEIGDVEASEVNAHLESFIEEAGFLKQLAASGEAAGRFAENSPDGASPGDEASQRAVEYANAAQRLDELYRQLVSPRLARLREIEQQASALAEQIGEGEAKEESAETKAGIGKLQKDLEEEGLDELAELLDGDEPPEGPSDDPSGAEFGAVGGSGPSMAMARRHSVSLVARELQARIQEIILLEIAADREAPVPAQYREAVDRYFRVIAGGADAEDRGR